MNNLTKPSVFIIESLDFADERGDGTLTPLGSEKTPIVIQEKSYELSLGRFDIKVSPKIPVIASFLGGLFTLVSLVLSQIGITAMALGSFFGGVFLIGYGAVLFYKSVKPLMSIIPIRLSS